MSTATGMGCNLLADCFRMTASLPLFSSGCKDETEAMHPHFASRLALDHEEEFRRRAETYRTLAEVCKTGARRRTFLEARLGRAVRRLRLPPRFGRPAPWPTDNPISNASGL